MSTPVILWLRVSDAHQNEDNQLPDLERWCADHDYRIVRTVFVHGKSAWKSGKLDKDKTAVLDTLRSGVATVVVAWAVDRWSRGGIADLLDGMQAVKEAGGRVEFVKDEALNVPGPAQELLMAVLAWVAKWESEHKSDRVKAGMARERANGKIMGGRVRFGYRLENGARHRDEKALDVVAEVFERSVRGESTATIGEFIRRSGYKRADNTVADIIRNDDYVADGVVSPAQAKRAREALEGRRTGPVRRVAAEDYSGMVYCRCGKPMHRVMAGGMPGKGVEPTRYYRCRGHEGKPVPMVRADDTDWLAEYAMSLDFLPWLIPVRTGGDTREADKARTWAEIDKAQKRRDRDEVNRLFALLDVIDARDPEPENLQWVPSGKTRGQRWEELTVAERRAWLDSEDTYITVWNVKEAHTGERHATDEAWARGKVRLVVVTEDGDERATAS